MSPHKTRSSAVIGTGMMGPGIAVSLALGGIEATLVSRSDEGAQQGLARAREQLDILAREGLATAGQAADARRRLLASTDLDGSVGAAGLVVESGPERMAFKRELFSRMDTVAPPETILASNTSGLSITEIASACNHPERVLTAHFWNPPHLMKLVEIVRGGETANSAVETMKVALEACGKTVVVVKKDRPGQLGNRLQHALVREAIYMIEEGIASPEDIDLAVKAGFGLRLPVYGLLEHQDAVGLDLVLAIQDYVNQDLCREPRAGRLLREMNERGEIGVKAGRGFYDWSKKSFSELRERRDRFLLTFLKSEVSGGETAE